MTTIAVPFFMGDPMPFRGQVEADTSLEPVLSGETPQQRMGELYAALAGWVTSVDQPVVMAGDCVSTIGVLAGLQRREISPTLYFFDAHGDFHTWETTPSQFIGGMPLAMLTGRGEQTIVEQSGLRPLGDERVVLVDGRDLDPGEDDAIAASGVEVLTVAEVASREPRPGPLYVHVDVDVVDPDDLPAVNYPAPSGPSLESVCSAVARLAASGRMVAFSISSWNPELPGAERAARASASIVAASGR